MKNNPEILVIEHFPGRAARIAGLLRQFGFPIRVRRFHLGEDAVVETSTIGVVLSGGPQSVCHLDRPEAMPLQTSIRLLGDAANKGVPVLGICLGHQLMAKWAGGRIERMAQPVTGFCDVSVMADDAVLRVSGPKLEVFEYHQDTITQAPAGFEIVAASNTCNVEAIRCLGLGFFGVQFHPEITRADGAAILNGAAPCLSPWVSESDVKGPLILEAFGRYCTTRAVI